jgi:hypothetical protein
MTTALPDRILRLDSRARRSAVRKLRVAVDIVGTFTELVA